MTETTTEKTTIEVRRRIGAPRARVFEAWTDPARLERWYALADDWSVAAEIDLRVGGSYRIEHTLPGGGKRVETGFYREIVPPERLVYTCRQPGLDGDTEVDTLVTVAFGDLGDATEVVVTEAGFGSTRERDVHASGWPRFIHRLERLTGA